MDNKDNTPATQPPARRFPAKAVIGFLIYLLLTPAALLLAGGEARWLAGWVFGGLGVAAALGSRLVALRTNPELLQERAHFAEAEGVQKGDRLLSLLVAIVGPLLAALVAGLDHRWGWSPKPAAGGQWGAMLLVALGYLLAVWAMLSNPYFSAVVRIQGERGHQVVSDGPYAALRHPAYAGGLLATLVTPFALSALWALLPAVLVVAGVVLRTQREDRLLLEALPGYREYAARVRYRLVPGVW